MILVRFQLVTNVNGGFPYVYDTSCWAPNVGIQNEEFQNTYIIVHDCKGFQLVTNVNGGLP